MAGIGQEFWPECVRYFFKDFFSQNPPKSRSTPKITLSVCYELLELYMHPDVCELQFSFRPNRSTSLACSFLSDIVQYFKGQDTPIHICSFDAEKCFDRIWHDGLFVKLYGKIPVLHWRFLLKWYRNSNAVVRWNGKISSSFNISRGTKQGSILSPLLFNVSIDELLRELKLCNEGVRIGRDLFNAFAYADDVTIVV